MRNKKITAIIFCALFMLGGMFIIKARSEEREIKYFDEQGRLSFTMRDNPAIHTAYKTIAWTIKKYDLPIGHPDNITVTVQLEDESFLGDDGFMHTTIYVSREAILEKVRECSDDWLDEIKRSGGIAYLDNIMTVSVDGVLQGAILEDGSYEGEVYDTFEGISQARNWKNPEDLKQYFGRMVAIPADEPKHEQKPPEDENVSMVSDYNYSDSGLSIGRTGRLTSKEYDVQQAVPVLENVDAQGSFSTYGYRLCYRKESGNRTYGVKVVSEYTLQWKDIYGNEYRDNVCVTDWYDVTRSYSHYVADTLDFYRLKCWQFENPAIGSHVIENTDNIEIIRSAIAYIEDAPFQDEVRYDGGVITGQGQRPPVPDNDLQWLAESVVGDINAVSDSILVNNFEILGENGAKKPAYDIMTDLSLSQIKINENTPNSTFATESHCEYQRVEIGGIETASDHPQSEYKNVLVNPLTIHTPVVCGGWISDNRADNQRIEPDETRISLVIGKSFRVNADNAGEHIYNKGYGTRDYNKYVLDNEICFPFNVVVGSTDGKQIKAGTWISLGKMCENNVFYLPVTVDEGIYSVKFRTRAVNEQLPPDAKDCAQQKANINPEYYCAYDTCEVYVSGQIYGFAITKCNDPRWEQMYPAAAGRLPLRNPALKLGYEFTFELTTSGNMTEEDMVCIKPHFYHEKEGGYNKAEEPYSLSGEVDLYEVYNNGSRKISVTKLGDVIEAGSITCIAQEYDGHIKRWRGTFKLPKVTAAVECGLKLQKLIDEQIVTGYDNLWENYIIRPNERARGGLIIVNFDIYTKKSGDVYLSYANVENSANGYCNMWKTEGYKAGGSPRWGDVALYSGNRNYMDDYIVYGTH